MNIRKWMMPNGLWVVNAEMPGSSLFNAFVYILGGPRVEVAPRFGVAHFLEHELFRGSTKYPDEKTVTLAIKKRGGKTNAFTSHELIALYIKSFKEHAGEMLDVLSDTAFNSFFSEETIAIERGAVLQEIKKSLDDPDDSVERAFDELIWRDHPLGRDILGTQETVSALKRDDFVQYHRENFYPGNMVLSVSGGLKAEEVFNLACRHFYLGERVAKTTLHKNVLSFSSEKIKLVDKPLEQANGMLGFDPEELFSFDAKFMRERNVARLLSGILGGDLGSRLYNAVRSEQGLVYTIYSHVLNYSDYGAFYVYFGTDADKSPRVVLLILDEIDKLMRKGVDDEELEIAKLQARQTSAEVCESSFSTGARLGEAELRGLEVAHPDEYFKKYIEPITIDEVIEMARHLFKADRSNVRLAVAGPISKEAKELENIMSV